jgi:fructose-1,6-bisphosphatase/inositol monophosphatase family enzyme
MLVAQGSIDAAVDAIGLGPYDIAALLPVVRAAGGQATTLDGVTDWRADHLVTSNGTLHGEVLALLNS